MRWLTTRLIISMELIRRQRIAAGIWALLTFLILIREELVPAAYRDRWRILELATGAPLWEWAIPALVLALLIVLEGAYKTVTARDATVSELNLQMEATRPGAIRLSDAARELLLAAAQSPDGKIVCFTTHQGPSIQSNRRTFNEGHTARETARWVGALEELERLGLVQAEGHKRVVFAVTDAGYELARTLG